MPIEHRLSAAAPLQMIVGVPFLVAIARIAPLYGYPKIYALTNVDVLAQEFVDRHHINVFE